MRAIYTSRRSLFSLTPVPNRVFSVSLSEIKEMQLKLNRMLNVHKLFGETPEFNYEQPKMIYDKETGDVTILPKSRGTDKRIIRTNKDLEDEKAKLFKEIGLEQNPDEMDLDTEEK